MAGDLTNTHFLLGSTGGLTVLNGHAVKALAHTDGSCSPAQHSSRPRKRADAQENKNLTTS